MALSEDRIARWARQLLVPGFGEAGQERLAASRVRVVGAGPVAGPALVYLVQAGFGRIWVDDPATVGPGDLSAWLYPPTSVGRPRAETAVEALAPLSRFTSVEPFPAVGVPTAALVCSPSAALALAVADQWRRARIPHVVVEVDGEGGAVIGIPPGAPCYSCARSVDSSGRPPLAGTAALGALAAEELAVLVAEEGAPGRRIDLVRGIATARPTLRLPGCECSP